MWLLDTNVVSEMRKLRTSKVDLNVSRWSETIDFEDAYLATVSLYELERGILLLERKDESQARLLRTWLSDFVLPTLEGRILPLSEAVAIKCAALNTPDPRPMIDSIIAATAFVHGLTIVTRNVADFEGIGVALVNPWMAQD